ncbi:MAG: glycosyltransferase family 39 protein [Arenicellales bacterium]
MIQPYAGAGNIGQDGEPPRILGEDGDPHRHQRCIYFSLIIFAVFALYYFITSSLLPAGAGPDYTTNNDAVRFIYTYHRLAVVPRDENKIRYSDYGDTRALRPPLSYIVSAVAARVLRPWIANSFILFRKGSALLAAATVAIAFYTGVLYFNSFGAGVIVALLFGLLPQFAFIASYNNDDSGAIFSASLMLCVLVRILRGGTNWVNAIVLGIAGGLVILSKPTAWLLAPTVLIFLALYVRAHWAALWKYASVALVVLVLSGGWWILFNMYHYGPGDPFVGRTEAALEARHSRFPPGKEFGYAAKGVGYADLLLNDHDNFWGKTIASTIGNLDWLRIRLGPLQYGLYLALFLVGGIYVVARVGALLYRRTVTGEDSSRDREVVFETLLVFAVLFQFCMYVWANMHNDIQLQGKYLLPVLLAPVLLGTSAVRAVVSRVAPSLMEREPGAVILNGRTVQRATILGTAVVLLGVHIDGLVNYVVPFYRPPVYPIRLHRGLQPINIPPQDVLRKHEISDFSMTPTGFRLVSEGTDPWFIVSISDERMCTLFQGHNLLQAKIDSGERGIFKVYVNKGSGFNEEDSYEVRYPAGRSDLVVVFDVPICSQLRIDPGIAATTVSVSNLSLGKIDIGR